VNSGATLPLGPGFAKAHPAKVEIICPFWQAPIQRVFVKDIHELSAFDPASQMQRSGEWLYRSVPQYLIIDQTSLS